MAPYNPFKKGKSGTYYAQSGTYVDSSGQGISTAVIPKGAEISLDKDPNLKKRSGGGGSSPGVSTTPQQSGVSSIQNELKKTDEKKLTQLEAQKKLLKISGLKNNRNVLDIIAERNRRERELSRMKSYDAETLKRKLTNQKGKSGYDILTEKLLENPEYLRKTTQALSRNVSKDFYNGDKLKKTTDILTEGKLTAKKYNDMQRQININVDLFNKKYGGKELSESEYNKANELLSNINYSQEFLDKQKEKATGELKKTIKELSISKKGVLPLIALGIVSGAVDYGYNAVQVSKDILNILRNPRNIKDLSPSNIYRGFKENIIKEISYIGFNKYFGIARVLTKTGLFFATAKLTSKGIRFFKKVNPKYNKKLISTMEKIPKKNIVNVEINTLVRRAGKNVSVAKITVDGKGISGIARGYVIKVGKNKVYTLATGFIWREGKFFKKAPNPFVTIGRGGQRNFLKTIQETGGIKIMKKYTAVGTKGYSITEIPLRKRDLFEKSIFKREHYIDEFLSKSIYNRLNKNLGYISGVSQSKFGYGLRFTGYIRDITDDAMKSLKAGKRIITSSKITKIKEEILENSSLTSKQKIVLIKNIDKAVNYAVENSLKESVNITNLVGGVVSKQSKKLISGIKNSLVRKVALGSLSKIVSVSTAIILQNSTKNKSLSKEKMISLLKSNLKSEIINKIISVQIIKVIQKTNLKTIKPIKTISGIVPIIPVPLTETKLWKSKEITGIPDIIKNSKGSYFGYDVKGISSGASKRLTKFPLSFKKSLSVASYFALNSKKGYSVLKPSSRKASKNIINRVLPKRIPLNYFSMNRNRLKIIKYNGRIIIKRR